MNVSELKNYYLLRCYEKNDYRKGFNEGSNIHISGMNYFYNAESDFQKDNEGVIFSQEPNSKGVIFSAPSNMSELLHDKGYFVKNENGFCFSANCSKKDIVNFFLQHAEQIATTESLILSLSGYICCFYLISKSDIEFCEKSVAFRNEKVKDDVFEFLLKYSRDKREETGVAYVTVYDAFLFVEKFCKGMSQKGYTTAFGKVLYEDITFEKRVEWFQCKDIGRIVFTKDKKFEYQKEFRIFLNTPNSNSKPFIEENGIDFAETIIKDFFYLSPEYAEKIMRKAK